MALGHTAYVSALAEITGGFVSGGGDNRVISWDLNGVQKTEYSISEGSCIRAIRAWKESIAVVGEK